MTSYLVLDIETVPDAELPLAANADPERLPAPAHHRVIVLGALQFDAAMRARRLVALEHPLGEAGILAGFAELLEDRRATLVTFNGRGFDLPVIATRCLRHGVALPRYYRTSGTRHRYSADGHLDLMDYIADFGAAKPSRLDVIARLCGMPGKTGIDGKDVGPLVQQGRHAEVTNYCLGDVVQTAAIFLRLQLVRGEIKRARYLDSMHALLALARSDERVARVALEANEDRLLLRGSG